MHCCHMSHERTQWTWNSRHGWNVKDPSSTSGQECSVLGQESVSALSMFDLLGNLGKLLTVVAHSRSGANCLDVGHGLQLLLHTRVLSLLGLLLAEQVDLMFPLPELEVVLLVEAVVLVGRLEDAIEDLELFDHQLPFCILAVPSWVSQRHG